MLFQSFSYQKLPKKKVPGFVPGLYWRKTWRKTCYERVTRTYQDHFTKCMEILQETLRIFALYHLYHGQRMSENLHEPGDGEGMRPTSPACNQCCRDSHILNISSSEVWGMAELCPACCSSSADWWWIVLLLIVSYCIHIILGCSWDVPMFLGCSWGSTGHCSFHFVHLNPMWIQADSDGWEHRTGILWVSSYDLEWYKSGVPFVCDHAHAHMQKLTKSIIRSCTNMVQTHPTHKSTTHTHTH